MKEVETQQRFIIMRAQGITFARIAQELDVAKTTLINWSRKFQSDISNERAIELEALQEKLIGARNDRLAAIAARLHEAEEEIKKRGLADIPTARLIALADTLRAQIASETGEPHFSTPADRIPEEEVSGIKEGVAGPGGN